MAVSADYSEIGREVAQVYARAETEILARVARRIARGIPADRAQLRPWELQKLNEIRQLRTEVARVLIAAESGVSAELRRAIEEAYAGGIEQAAAELAAEGRELGALSLPRLRQTGLAVDAFTEEALGRVVATHSGILRAAVDVYRKVIARAVEGAITSTEAPRVAAQRALRDFADKGISGFVDNSGRRWSLSTYADMATRTAAQRAAVRGALDRIEEEGIDLVMVANIAEECPLCRPWEGKVLRRSGRVDGEGLTVDDARSAGLFHPNCRHALIPYIEGVTKIPAPHSIDDPKGHAEREKHRALERDVRRWKRREAAALDDIERRAVQARLRASQSRLRGFLDETGRKRQPWRESITAKERTALAPKGGLKPITRPAPAPPRARPATPPATPRVSTRSAGEVLDVQVARPAGRKVIADAIAAIEKVHRIPGGKGTLPVKSARSGLGAIKCQLVGDYSGTKMRPIHIEIATTQPLARQAMVHEFGHFIDISMVGVPGRFTSQAGGEFLGPWREAIRKTAAYRDLAGRKVSARERKLLEYFLSDEEVWARSYAQYIGTKNGGRILEEIRLYRAEWAKTSWPGLNGMSVQWSEEDFAPMMPVFDALFRRLGWLNE